MRRDELRRLISAEHVFEPLAPVSPRLDHDVLAVEAEQVEGGKGGIAAVALAGGEDRVDAIATRHQRTELLDQVDEVREVVTPDTPLFWSTSNQGMKTSTKFKWWLQRDSNPCFSLERAVS
jgi:hypothetical protein